MEYEDINIGRSFRLIYKYDDKEGAYVKARLALRFMKITELHAFETTDQSVHLMENIEGFYCELTDSCINCKQWKDKECQGIALASGEPMGSAYLCEDHKTFSCDNFELGQIQTDRHLLKGKEDE